MNGSETSVIFCGKPGQIFGELAALDGKPRSASALAAKEVELYFLHRHRLLHFMRIFPQLGINLAMLLSKRVRYNTVQVDSLSSGDVLNRWQESYSNLPAISDRQRRTAFESKRN